MGVKTRLRRTRVKGRFFFLRFVEYKYVEETFNYD